MNRLAIDPGPSATGWALELDGEITEFGERRFRDAGRGRFLGWEAVAGHDFAVWLTYLSEKHRIDQIVVEEAFIGRPSPDTKWVAWAQITVSILCLRKQIEYRPISNSVMKKFACHGRASPREMINAAKRAGFDVSSDHQADALFLLLSSQEGALPGPLGLSAIEHVELSRGRGRQSVRRPRP